jgi:hypothetical protein
LFWGKNKVIANKIQPKLLKDWCDLNVEKLGINPALHRFLPVIL